MTAAFILTINLFVAALFAVAFLVVAAHNPTARGARWLAAAYAIGMVDIALEFVLPRVGNPVPVVIAIFGLFLAALTCGLVGISLHYRRRPPVAAIGALWLVSLVMLPFMLSLAYGSGWRWLLYQLPYAAMQTLMTITVVRWGRRMALDVLLAVVSGVATLTYMIKPMIAWQIGTASGPQGYLASSYAAISQTLGSVVLIALALALLLVMMRDMTIEMVTRSETDPLSGILNRRGFEVHAERALARAKRWDTPLALVTADIDRFKAINDSYGHAVGDTVIADVARLLRDTVGSDHVIARLGGEEFAVLLPGKTAEQALAMADGIRAVLPAKLCLPGEDAPAVTASFGVAQLREDDHLSDLCRRSDLALYEAKAGGRNKVVVCASARVAAVRRVARAAAA